MPETMPEKPGPSMLDEERDALEKRRLEDLNNCRAELDKKWTQELEHQEKVVAMTSYCQWHSFLLSSCSIQSIRQSFRKEREDRMSRMRDIETQAEKLERILQWHSEHQKLGHHVRLPNLLSCPFLFHLCLFSFYIIGTPADWRRAASGAGSEHGLSPWDPMGPRGKACRRGLCGRCCNQRRTSTSFPSFCLETSKDLTGSIGGRRTWRRNREAAAETVRDGGKRRSSRCSCASGRRYRWAFARRNHLCPVGGTALPREGQGRAVVSQPSLILCLPRGSLQRCQGARTARPEGSARKDMSRLAKGRERTSCDRHGNSGTSITFFHYFLKIV